MIIYGTAILAACYLSGIFLGDLLGSAIGAKANVGGVGIAMILLIVAKIYLEKYKLMPKATEGGINFWGALYIPVVVAMAAQQNVVVALRGGWVAVISAAVAFALCCCVIATLSRMGNRGTPLPPIALDVPADAVAH